MSSTKESLREKHFFYSSYSLIANYVIIIITALVQFIPFWAQQYMPIILSYPFYVYALMFGFHALSCVHYRIEFIGMNFLFSFIGLISWAFYLNEWLFRPLGCSTCVTATPLLKFEGRTNYSMLAGTLSSTVINTTTWGNEGVSISWWNGLIWQSSILAFFSLIHFILSASAMSSIRSTEKFRVNDWVYLGSRYREVAASRMVVTILCMIGVILGVVQIVFMYLMEAQSTVLLDPIYNPNFLYFYLSAACLWLPQPSAVTSRFHKDPLKADKDSSKVDESDTLIVSERINRIHRHYEPPIGDSKQHVNKYLTEIDILVFGRRSPHKIAIIGLLYFGWILSFVLTFIAGVSERLWLGYETQSIICSISAVTSLLDSQITFGFFNNQTYLQFQSGNHDNLPTSTMSQWACVDEIFIWVIFIFEFITLISFAVYLNTFFKSFSKLFNGKDLKTVIDISVNISPTFRDIIQPLKRTNV